LDGEMARILVAVAKVSALAGSSQKAAAGDDKIGDGIVMANKDRTTRIFGLSSDGSAAVGLVFDSTGPFVAWRFAIV
jgi:hypothetical protein